MKVITEQFLRKLLFSKQLTKGSTLEISAKTKVTPSALAFARENSIVLQKIEEESMNINLTVGSNTKKLNLTSKLLILEKIYEVVLALQDTQANFDAVFVSDLISLANRLKKYLSTNTITVGRKEIPDLSNFEATLYALPISLDYNLTKMSHLFVKLMSLYTLTAVDRFALNYIVEMLEIVQEELQKVGE